MISGKCSGQVAELISKLAMAPREGNDFSLFAPEDGLADKTTHAAVPAVSAGEEHDRREGGVRR